jgi:hypothetical protein
MELKLIKLPKNTTLDAVDSNYFVLFALFWQVHRNPVLLLPVRQGGIKSRP